MASLPPDTARFEASVDVAIVGAGACGLTAALAAAERGADVAVFERDATPSGSTTLSSGMVPAAGTRLQATRGVPDSPEAMFADLMAKTHGQIDQAVARAVCERSGPTVDWLADTHGLDFELVEGFVYPGHSHSRMHAPKGRTGAVLMAMLLAAVERAGVPVVTDARVASLFADADGRVRGLRVERPDGSGEDVACAALVLACNGFGGAAEMVREHIPEMADALYFGHTGNRGDAVAWGDSLGAATADMGAYQGHGSVAHPHGILITWGLIMAGGIQVNAEGRRFSDETQGYSEQARRVLAQPGGTTWVIFDEARHRLGMAFDDYRNAHELGAIKVAQSVAELTEKIGTPEDALAETLAEVTDCARTGRACRFGRDFSGVEPLAPPYRAVRVTGALFHTQGGLVIDTDARVLRGDGTPLPNLYAAGGAARGLSGPGADGYLSGNGLLSAVVLGRTAGAAAARNAGRRD
jgi:fumarate reductase flavoprotein subunit